MGIKFVEWQPPLHVCVKLKEVLSEWIGDINRSHLHHPHARNLPLELGSETRISYESLA